MSLNIGQTVVLILVIGMLAALICMVILQIREDKRKNSMTPAPRFKVGEVLLTEQGVNYLVNRMRDSILEREADNERLRRELRLSNERVWHLMNPWWKVEVKR